MYDAARSRSLVGNRGFGAYRNVAEPRDRIALVGWAPGLPDGWKAWACILSAHGDRFSGDFVVADLSASGDRLEIVLVDVNGKEPGRTGCAAASPGARRAARVDPLGHFLRATNEYLRGAGLGAAGSPPRCTSTSTCASRRLHRQRRDPSPARYPPAGGRACSTGARPLLRRHARRLLPRRRVGVSTVATSSFYSDGVIESRVPRPHRRHRPDAVAAMSVLGEGDVARHVRESARSGRMTTAALARRPTTRYPTLAERAMTVASDPCSTTLPVRACTPSPPLAQQPPDRRADDRRCPGGARARRLVPEKAFGLVGSVDGRHRPARRAAIAYSASPSADLVAVEVHVLGWPVCWPPPSARSPTSRCTPSTRYPSSPTARRSSLAARTATSSPTVAEEQAREAANGTAAHPDLVASRLEPLECCASPPTSP